MPLYTHSSGEEFTQSETYGWFEKALIVAGSIVFAVFVYLNLPMLLWALGGIL